ncbi:hypothetical protein SAMN05443245_6877 [Paraburkholderia fungorum]|uniref:Uncharacterized protein n=1 Tax=Paraburkholderia fungorum TaxID=134537 RepID=A0A1H1JMK9_9BURK|nr:hypothetical protein [Paraburkholderia fungorum]SDR51261.1 hypothetical protein SAMN05443245_6877 [Paraburkholderia fungorum]
MLIEAVNVKLERVIPEEMKPFTTNRQVLAFVMRFANEQVGAFRSPRHLSSLANAIHTAFIHCHTNQCSIANVELARRNAIEEYRRGAYQAGVASITSAFQSRMAAQKFNRAKLLNIDIDRHYPWGALTEPPRRAKDMLADLAVLISMDREWYKKWRPENLKIALPDTSADQFIARSLWINRRVTPRSASGPMYFSSERSDIAINGMPLQKQLAMVLPYDRPFPELDQALSRFEKYLERRAAEYRFELQDDG